MSEAAHGNKASIEAISTRPVSHAASRLCGFDSCNRGVVAGAIDLAFNTVKAVNAGTSV